ncbi:MAG: hypothetical protein K8F56_18275, partial [Rhodocyclaceae bacterium]|nr:hypothetical protein [Rhodocyclaceae bacterium]
MDALEVGGEEVACRGASSRGGAGVGLAGMSGRSGRLQCCLAIALALGGMLPVATEVVTAFGSAEACGCDAAAACPM